MIDAERSPRLLAHAATGPAVLADEEALPFAPASLDLVVSGLALQLVNDLPGTLAADPPRAEARRAPACGAARRRDAARAARSLARWPRTRSRAVPRRASRRSPTCAISGALLQRAGFALPVVDADTVTVIYASPLALMGDIKAMGASNMLADAPPQAGDARPAVARGCEIYAERFARADGRVPATFEILTLTAWAPHESQPKPLQARLGGGAPRRRARRDGAQARQIIYHQPHGEPSNHEAAIRSAYPAQSG